MHSEDILIRMEKGDADKREIPMLEEISRQIDGHTIYALGDTAACPVQELVVLIIRKRLITMLLFKVLGAVMLLITMSGPMNMVLARCMLPERCIFRAVWIVSC